MEPDFPTPPGAIELPMCSPGNEPPHQHFTQVMVGTSDNLLGKPYPRFFAKLYFFNNEQEASEFSHAHVGQPGVLALGGVSDPIRITLN